MQRSETAAPGSSQGRHTPGPWKVTATDPAGKSEWFDIHADRPKRQDCHYIGAVNGPQNDIQRANAHLMAAAPDLYDEAKNAAEALAQAALHLEEMNLDLYAQECRRHAANLQAALAKAEGRS